MATGVIGSDSNVCSMAIKDAMHYYASNLTQVTVGGSLQDIGDLKINSYNVEAHTMNVNISTLPNWTYYGGVTLAAPTCDTTTMQSYLFAEVGQTVGSGSEPSGLNEYNYVDAAALWTFAFTTVISLWWVAKNIGTIINAVKRF